MADSIPWSDLDGTRTPTARDTALMAAWRTFTAQPRVGNTHDWLWAAIVHGYDIGVAGKVAAVRMWHDEFRWELSDHADAVLEAVLTVGSSRD